MATYIIVLQHDVPNPFWIARAWGTDLQKLCPGCTYNSGNNQQFPKNPGDQQVNGPCTNLTDQFGNSSPVITVKLA